MYIFFYLILHFDNINISELNIFYISVNRHLSLIK